MINKEEFDTIIQDIRDDTGFIDVQKADFMDFMISLYPCYSSKELKKEIENLG